MGWQPSNHYQTQRPVALHLGRVVDPICYCRTRLPVVDCHRRAVDLSRWLRSAQVCGQALSIRRAALCEFQCSPSRSPGVRRAVQPSFVAPLSGRSQSRSAVVRIANRAAQRSFAEPIEPLSGCPQFSGRSHSPSSRSAVVRRADKRSFTQPVFSLRLVPVIVIMGVSQTCNLGCPFDNSAGTICSLKTNRNRDSWLRRAEFKLAFTPALTTTSHR